MLTICIILIIVSILLVIYAVYALKHTHKINQEIDKINNDLKIENTSLFNQNNQLKGEVNNTEQIIELKNKELKSYQEQLDNIQNNISKTLDNQKELSQKAFENYCEVLDKQYEEEELEYDMYKDALQTAYTNLQLKLMREADECRADLDKVKATRAAAMKAIIREKEIKEQLSFYCIQVSPADLADIKFLETIKPKLNNVRVLNMLIWQSFFQKPMNTLCNNVIGTSVKSGIYKITNQTNGMSYIGQAVDLATRWKNHCKAGLGIDTPANNKLYRAMMEDGLWNFSFEIVEECPSNQLNEKEKYYIELYDSKSYGYNQNQGISK